MVGETVVLHGAQVREITEGVDTADNVVCRCLVLTQYDKDVLVGNILGALENAVRHQTAEQPGVVGAFRNLLLKSVQGLATVGLRLAEAKHQATQMVVGHDRLVKPADFQGNGGAKLHLVSFFTLDLYVLRTYKSSVNKCQEGRYVICAADACFGLRPAIRR